MTCYTRNPETSLQARRIVCPHGESEKGNSCCGCRSAAQARLPRCGVNRNWQRDWRRIFLVPSLVARQLRSAAAILGVWTFASVISFFGSLACAELGTMLPSTGGQYVFLREAYGPLVGFLCGWSMFLVARTAQVAWLAVTLALYVSYFIRLSAPASKLLGIGAITLFTWINYQAVTAGAALQKVFTLAKVGGLLLIVCSAFLWGSKAAPATD